MKKKRDILFLRRSEIDSVKYNKCIREAKNSLAYAFSFYLDAVCDDWSVLILGDYEMVMPLPLRKKYGVLYVYPPFFTQQLGVFSSAAIPNDILLDFISDVPKEVQFIQTNLNFANPCSQNCIERRNLVLSLNQTYEKLRSGYSKTLDRNLKKTQSISTSIESTDDTARFLAFFKMHTLAKTKVIKKADVVKLESLVDVLMANSIAKIFVVKAGDEWLSATLFLITKDRITNLLVANSNKYKELNSSSKLLDHIIELYANTSYLLDFEGSEIEGVAKFYTSFGAAQQNYFQYTLNRLPRLLRWIKG